MNLSNAPLEVVSKSWLKSAWNCTLPTSKNTKNSMKNSVFDVFF